MSCSVMRCHEAPGAPGLCQPPYRRAWRMSPVRFRHGSQAPSPSGIEKAAPQAACPLLPSHHGFPHVKFPARLERNRLSVRGRDRRCALLGSAGTLSPPACPSARLPGRPSSRKPMPAGLPRHRSLIENAGMSTAYHAFDSVKVPWEQNEYLSISSAHSGRWWPSWHRISWLKGCSDNGEKCGPIRDTGYPCRKETPRLGFGQ